MRAIKCILAGLLFMLTAVPIEAELLDVLICTFKDGSNKSYDVRFEESIAWHKTKEFLQGISGPVLLRRPERWESRRWKSA
jgi:hypothetical protein